MPLRGRCAERLCPGSRSHDVLKPFGIVVALVLRQSSVLDGKYVDIVYDKKLYDICQLDWVDSVRVATRRLCSIFNVNPGGIVGRYIVSSTVFNLSAFS